LTETEIEKEINLEELFFRIIANKEIKIVFQPIISLRDGAVYGYESLCRGPVNTNMQSPIVLFEFAEKHNKLWELELLCRTKALEAAYSMNKDVKLFINVNPNIMDDIKFKQGFTKEHLEMFSINPDNIIFEITEREAIKNISLFVQTVQNYKDQNYMIAIDDAGAGYSGLNLISDIRPHFIKLDMNLVRDVDKNNTKQSLLKSLCEFATLTNTLLIAEGIETERELVKLIELGIHYGQGYFIQRPNSSIIPIQGQILKIINEANDKKNHIYGSRITDIYINNICSNSATVNPNILVSQINEMINNNFGLPGFCVTENDRILGVITRNQLNKYLSAPYGYHLYANKPVKDILNTDFMKVDYKTPIDIVAKIAMQREIDKVYDFIAVTKDDKYFGVVTVKDLLEKTIQIEIVNAKHLNPLSELPGNMLIEKQLEYCIATCEKYCVLYLDIDNFKAYNDVYGFERGDYVIKIITQILKRNIPKTDFIGHIGGDDFLAIMNNNGAKELCINIIHDFDKAVHKFYNQADLNRGYIVAKNRHGVEESFPLLSITIVGVSNENFKNIYDLTEYAAKTKKICKQKWGSNYLIL
jgi:diguanylate cyclase (GGDEF)-like protein